MGNARLIFGLGIEFVNSGAGGGRGFTLVGLVRGQRYESSPFRGRMRKDEGIPMAKICLRRG